MYFLDFQLTFNFTLNTGRSRELEIKSRRKLNGGEWQKIWIDYNEHHVRFMINTDYQMVDLLPEEEFGPFEGSMFIGGATQLSLKKRFFSTFSIGFFFSKAIFFFQRSASQKLSHTGFDRLFQRISCKW